MQRQIDQLLVERETLRQQLAAPAAVSPCKYTPGDERVVAIPYCDRDFHGVLTLLGWMKTLGRVNATVVLCAPHGLDVTLVDQVSALADQVFSDVLPIRTAFDLPKEGWPTGTVWSFLHIAKTCRERRWDFWLNEPDCIPLRPGWFDDLAAEYARCGRPYMGFIEPAHTAGYYPRHMTGNGFYNWTVFQHVRADRMDMAWDVAMAEALTPQCHNTRLFHQEFGPLDRPPTFPSVDALASIPVGAAVFHRNKDGSLIRQLMEARKP